MMKTRLIVRLAAALVLLLAVCSCRTETAHGGVVTFRFATGALQTRATTPGDGDVADGGGISSTGGLPDLIILIAKDADGSIVKRYDGLNPGTDVQLKSLTATEAVVAFDFTDQTPGDYSVYAFGNARGLWPMTTDGSNTLSRADLLTLSNRAQLEALQFRPLAADTAPELIDLGADEARMPLSAAGAFTVYAELNGQVGLELLRCVAKVTYELVNNTGEELTLTDFRDAFVGMCPDRGFVLEQDPAVPAEAVSGTLVATNSSLTIPAFVPDPDDPSRTIPGRVSDSRLVFPSTGPYTSDISFSLGGSAYSYSGLPITDSRRADIPSLSRNQQLRVMTRISKGVVSFNFEVADWVEKNEEVQFD